MIIIATIIFIILFIIGACLAANEVKNYDNNGRPLDTGLFKKNKKK